MGYQLIKRAAYGLDPVVRTSTGSPRPAISNCDWVTVHYTGVDVRYGDEGDTPAEIRAIERWAASQSKPNEYNYVIGQDHDRFVYEYAGAFRAAHSGGENTRSVGVLFLNGTKEPPTDQQIDKLRWLRDEVLKPSGVVKRDVATTPHKNMPGAATACPGSLILDRWDEFVLPWGESPTPIPPPSPIGGLRYVVEKGDNYWSISRKLFVNGDSDGNPAALETANDGRPLHAGDLIRVPGHAKR